jgi:hypothetical protein
MLSSILAILDKILTVLLVWKRSVDQKKAQERRYELEKNPDHWFSNHFSDGMLPRTPQSGINETSSTETSASGDAKS